MKLPFFFLAGLYSLMSVAKARSLTYRGAPEASVRLLMPTWHITYTYPARDKHFRLLQKFVNYDRNFFNKISTWAECYKTLYDRNLRVHL